MRRYQKEAITKDLEKKMVFIVGPRQVGKTWISKEIGKKFNQTVYLNYDYFEDREIIKNAAWLPKTELLIFDELHKMPDWKNYLKGVYDTKPDYLKILVTGSARLDTFRSTGDSLAGRFFRHRLLPFSPAEFFQTEQEYDLEKMIQRGGFPEPLSAVDDIESQRWRSQYIDGLIRTDILDFEKIHDFKAIQMVFELLRRRVGSPISYSSIARDVGIAPQTVIKYIQIFESLFIVFRVSPFSKNIARSILKEPKIYFFDNGLVMGDEGIEFENFMATCLLKHIYGKNDYLGESYKLQYLRTKEQKEVDFCLTRESEIESLIEVKYRDRNISPSLLYFCKKYGLKGYQVVQELHRERMADTGIEVRRGEDFLRELYL